MDIFTPQTIPLNVLITGLHELNLQKRFEMVDTRSYMQLDDLNSKPHGGKGLQDIINPAIGVCVYPPPGSKQYTLLILDKFHGSTNINDNHSEIKILNSLFLYNVIHQTHAGNIRTKILSLTMYTYVDLKKRAFFKTFCTYLNKQMILSTASLHK